MEFDTKLDNLIADFNNANAALGVAHNELMAAGRANYVAAEHTSKVQKANSAVIDNAMALATEIWRRKQTASSAADGVPEAKAGK